MDGQRRREGKGIKIDKGQRRDKQIDEKRTRETKGYRRLYPFHERKEIQRFGRFFGSLFLYFPGYRCVRPMRRLFVGQNGSVNLDAIQTSVANQPHRDGTFLISRRNERTDRRIDVAVVYSQKGGKNKLPIAISFRRELPVGGKKRTPRDVRRTSGTNVLNRIVNIYRK